MDKRLFSPLSLGVFAVGGVDVGAVSGVVHGLVVGDMSLA
jgi:hypothetical protein